VQQREPQRYALDIFFSLIPNALEPSKTLLKGAYLLSFTYESFAIIPVFYFGMSKKKEITVKPSKMKGHTFSNTTYSKAISIISMVSKTADTV